MEFRIADTSADNLGRTTAHEQKAVETAAFDGGQEFLVAGGEGDQPSGHEAMKAFAVS